MLLEAGVEGFDLGAGGAEAGDFEDGCCFGFLTDVELGAAGQGEEIDAFGEEVFAQVAGVEREAESGEFDELFGGEEVDLSEVGGGGVFALAVEVLDGGAAVGVVFDAFAGDETDVWMGLFGEAVGRAERGGEDDGHG
jgi:hypothetical protein